jgi:hypothetical protein
MEKIIITVQEYFENCLLDGERDMVKRYGPMVDVGIDSLVETHTGRTIFQERPGRIRIPQSGKYVFLGGEELGNLEFLIELRGFGARDRFPDEAKPQLTTAQKIAIERKKRAPASPEGDPGGEVEVKW